MYYILYLISLKICQWNPPVNFLISLFADMIVVQSLTVSGAMFQMLAACIANDVLFEWDLGTLRFPLSSARVLTEPFVEMGLSSSSRDSECPLRIFHVSRSVLWMSIWLTDGIPVCSRRTMLGTLSDSLFPVINLLMLFTLISRACISWFFGSSIFNDIRP